MHHMYMHIKDKINTDDLYLHSAIVQTSKL